MPMYLLATEVNNTEIFNGTHVNEKFNDRAAYPHLWYCPEGAPPMQHTGSDRDSGPTMNDSYVRINAIPSTCPVENANIFFQTFLERLIENPAYNETDPGSERFIRNDDLSGINLMVFAFFTILWIGAFFMLFRGSVASGKVNKILCLTGGTCLAILIVVAFWLDTEMRGLTFTFGIQNGERIAARDLWPRAAQQVFFSLGIGLGPLVAYGSSAPSDTNFVKHAVGLAFADSLIGISCCMVIFPMLGFLATELEHINPCYYSDVETLKTIGIQGIALVFTAVPTALSMSQLHVVLAAAMSALFFLLIFCLGITSLYGFVYSLIVVAEDSFELELRPSRWKVTVVVCSTMWFFGILFCSNTGFWWWNLLDQYTTLISIDFVCIMEAVGLMWVSKDTWPAFQKMVFATAGVEVHECWGVAIQLIAPLGMVLILVLTLEEAVGQLGEGASEDRPMWSTVLGWILALFPIVACAIYILAHRPKKVREAQQETPLFLRPNVSVLA